MDGEAIYSEEVTWEPRKYSDPSYHYNEIMTALKTAAGKIPCVDAIGGTSSQAGLTSLLGKENACFGRLNKKARRIFRRALG